MARRGSQPNRSGKISSWQAPSSNGQSGATSQYSRNNPAYSRKRKMGTGKKIAIGVVTTLVVLLVGAGSAFAVYMNGLETSLKGDLTEEEVMAIDDVTVEVASFDEPFYIMLIGSDARVDDEEMGKRADTSILARVDASTGTVTLVSILRDTKISINGYGTQKFNAAYSYDGVAGTIREASKLCGVEIAYYAEVDFDRLIALIDTVGGIEVDVPELIDDPQAGAVVIQPGPQTLNGEQSLAFARSRQYADGDFTRTSNQRLIIEGLIKKILSLSPAELPGVIQDAVACVTTNLTASDLFSLATHFQNAPQLTIYSVGIPAGTTMIDGISYVIADPAMLKEMMVLVDSGQDPNIVYENNVVTIPESSSSGSSGSNSSGYSGNNANNYSDTSGGGGSSGGAYVDPGPSVTTPDPGSSSGDLEDAA